MIPFRVHFRPGISLYEQVVYAAKKAMISGQMRPGDSFPSVRVLSREFKINPNTAHKVVMHLVNTGLLETRPGIGTVVAQPPESSRLERTQLLGQQIEELVVEGRKLGITLEEIMESIEAQWKRLDPNESGSSGATERDRGGRGKK